MEDSKAEKDKKTEKKIVLEGAQIWNLEINQAPKKKAGDDKKARDSGL